MKILSKFLNNAFAKIILKLTTKVRKIAVLIF